MCRYLLPSEMPLGAGGTYPGLEDTVQDLPEQHPLAEAAVPLACTTQMHQDAGQISPGPPPLAEGSLSARTSHALTCAIASIWSGKFGPAVGFHVPLRLPARGWHTHTQSKIVTCVRVTPKGPSTGF